MASMRCHQCISTSLEIVVLEKTLVLPASTYVVRSDGVCTLGFGEMEVTTETNGPLWILGMGIFFEYHVGFDFQKQPHAMSFTRITPTNPCSRCHGREASSYLEIEQHIPFRQSLPRKIRGPTRIGHHQRRSLMLAEKPSHTAG